MNKHNKFYLTFMALVSALGGFLFGYDWVVIGGAKPFYEVFFQITNMPAMQGWVMSSAILGCIIGVMTSGSLADRYGRKPMMFLAAIIFIIAAIGTGAVSNLSWFIVLRIFGGIGIGIASNISPMYIAEIAPADERGRYVSINQLTIVLGILSAQLINWLIAEPVAATATIGDVMTSWNGQMGWRWMFWAGGVPAVIFFLVLFLIPESPRWLATHAHTLKAEKVFQRIGGADYAKEQLHAIQQTEQAETTLGFFSLFRGKIGRILLVGIVIAVFQQWCGINVIFNYAQEIFAAAGYGVSDILFNIVVTGITNVVFTFIGMYTVDKLGRRALMLFGASSLAVIYAIIGICYYYQVTGVTLLILVVLAIAAYAMTLAPITWVVISEIFPNSIRAKAMAISTFALWTACFILTYTFPLLNKGLGAHGTFWLYGLICVVGFVFIKQRLPETKGKSLEEIEKELVG